MPPLIHLIYASVATEPFSTDELAELLQISRYNNQRAGLTGMLLYSEGNFFQVLEGEPARIDELYDKLLRDFRHAQVTTIMREPIVKRTFADWSMGFSSAPTEELRAIEGLNDFFQKGACFVDMNPGRAKKLLGAFASGRWRTKLAAPVAATRV